MYPPIRWNDLAVLAEKTAPSGPDQITILEWQLLETTLSRLESTEDWAAVLRLRDMFDALVKGETSGGIALIQRLNDAALTAAERSEEHRLQARYLYDRGENLHRQGYHLASIEAFSQASRIYEDEGDSQHALRSYYFTSLPYRAIGEVDTARTILENVLKRIDATDPWRANPLQVLSWLERDAGRLAQSEAVLREALQLYIRTDGPASAHVVQTLADLGEIVGIQGRAAEGFDLFLQSTSLANQLGGQYNRQGARTRLKHAELLIREANYDQALLLLNEADDLIRSYGHYYDLLWRIELARAFAFAAQRRWGDALLKLRATIRFRNELGLKNSDLIRQLATRRRRGTGLPK